MTGKCVKEDIDINKGRTPKTVAGSILGICWKETRQILLINCRLGLHLIKADPIPTTNHAHPKEEREGDSKTDRRKIGTSLEGKEGTGKIQDLFDPFLPIVPIIITRKGNIKR